MRLCTLLLVGVATLGASAAAPGTAVPFQGVARVHGAPQVDAVVWLDSHDPVSPGQPTQPVMDQRSLQFFPQVLAVRVGTTVRFPNSDRVFHNIFSFKDGKQFDLGVYPIGAVKFVRFDRPGVSRLFCNIHPRMAAYVVAVDSPYFATTDATGRFRIDAPPGRYTWHAWRAGGETLSGSVTVTDATPLPIDWP